MPKFLSPGLVALLSGVVMSFAAAPFSFWWLAWIALVPLWIAIATPSSKPARLGLLWGIGYYGTTLHWITGLHPLMWLGIPWIGSIAIVAFAWTFITLWGAIGVSFWAWGMAWIARRTLTAWQQVLIGVALWCGIETLRQASPLDWAPLAFTQSPHNLAVLHLGRISGAMTVTGAIVLVNGLIAQAYLSHRLRFGTSAIACIFIVHLVGFGLFSINPPAIDAIRVGIVQGNVPTREKLFENGLKLALDHYAIGYRSLSNQAVELVVTPEGALPILWQGLDRTRNSIYQAVLNRHVPILLGTFVPQGNGYTQSLIALDRNGETVGRYNKIKLVPLGEYMPFANFFGRLSPIKSYLLPGAMHQIVKSPVGRIVVGICFDSAFPEAFRHQAAQGGQFIVTASNLDPYSQVLMAQHQAQDVMRSVETDRWAARATNTGYSGIIDSHGRIKWRSTPNQFDFDSAMVERRQTQTLYVRWGNWLTPTLLIMSAILVLRHRNST